MKITAQQFRDIVREEATVNESWALVGQVLLQLIGSAQGRKMLAGALNGLSSAQEWFNSADDWALEQVGLETPELINKFQALQTAGPKKLAEFIEGMTDEDAETIGMVAQMAGKGGSPKGQPKALAAGHDRTLTVTQNQLRRIIREALLVEVEMLKIMDNPYEDLSTYNRIANYALTNDIAGAIADPEVNTDELYWELDEMRGWVEYVGEDDGHFSDDVVTPPNWDLDKVYDFMGDLENAWHKDQSQKDDAAIAADPDKAWLKFMGDKFISTITPKDLETLGWKEYKRYVRLSPPQSISHGVGEIHITNDEFGSGSPGTREEFVEFLTNRAGQTLKKRKIYRSPPPLYD